MKFESVRVEFSGAEVAVAWIKLGDELHIKLGNLPFLGQDHDPSEMLLL